MKQLNTIIIIVFFTGLIFSQDYTWNKHNTPYTGGHQTNGSYTTFVSPNWFHSGTLTNPEFLGYSGFLNPKLDTRPPAIDSIIDVPYDQGRWVQVSWSKCGYDEFYNQNNYYSIWREDDDPGL